MREFGVVYETALANRAFSLSYSKEPAAITLGERGIVE